MTRAGYSVLHGNFSLAIKLNPLIYGVIVLFIVEILADLKVFSSINKIKRIAWFIFIIALLIFFVCRAVYEAKL
jgi:hypothetical protein